MPFTRKLFRRRRALGAALMAAWALAALAVASGATATTTPAVVPHDQAYAGKTYGEWQAAWWQWAIAQPADHHPLSGADPTTGQPDPLATCDKGQSGPVWFLGGVVNGSSTITRACAVPAGRAILFPVANGECSNLEAPPFFGATAADRSACAKALVDKATDLRADFDHMAIAPLSAFRGQSPNFTFTLPKCPAANILGVKCSLKRGQAVDDGYYVLLAPPTRGRHELHFEASFPDFGFALDITYNLNVI